ncbi:DNA gyrase inhibitor YacG [Candidatus Liberibacter sp.]|uniref:DNA gyrase inhibitor YacG n=1 Tax=Candidatus Liberibacter sp. TaxID=34022 RepID=UPI0038F7CB8A
MTTKKSDFSGQVYPCPECGEHSRNEFYPFCSTRCRSIDLSCWLSGVYRIEGKEGEVPDKEEVEEKTSRDAII